MNITHEHRKYKEKWNRLHKARYNGAYYYSKEIVKNIIPNVDTDRSWITVNLPGIGCDHSIIFVHNNLHPEHYDWLKQYKDIVLVCGVPETCEKVKHLGKTIYLPLSIDVEEVVKHKKEELKGKAYAGRASKRRMLRSNIPNNVAMVEGLPRDKFLEELSKYETVYAVGRVAIEAKALGAKIGVYDERFPNPDIWKVLDNRDAAKILQAELSKIDKPEKAEKEEQADEPNMDWLKADLIKYAEEHDIFVDKRDTKAMILQKIKR